jgi:hypothetical protein
MTRIAALVFFGAMVGCAPAPTDPMFDTGAAPRDAAVSDAALSDAAASDASFLPDTGADARTDGGTDASAADAAAIGDAGRDAASVAGDASVMADHLLISEIAAAPGTAEFFEIWNPTSAAIALDDYYVSDNATYYGIATAQSWNPPTSNPGTDFLVRFPAGASIPAGGVYTVALTRSFEATYGRCASAITDTTPFTCADGRSSAPMIVPTNGGLDPTHLGTLLSDAREMIVLFHWDGVATAVRDVDYVTWGATFDVGASRVDKTGVAGYAPDTAAAAQHGTAAPTSGQSVVRCGGEVGETTTGGNGLGGHDETSEHLDTAFGVVGAPTPGVHSGCS